MKNKSLKTEYVKLLRISKTQLRRELRKPESRQDRDLIAESVESIAFCEQELARLAGERASSRGGLYALRKAGAMLLVLLVSFAVFATVSEAVGFRVWTAMIKRDAGYLRVDYVPEPTKAPVEIFKGWEDGEYSFFTSYEFNDRLMKDGFSPFTAEENLMRFMEGSIRSTERDYYATYSLRGDNCTIRVRMIAKAGEPGPVTVWGMNESIPYREIDCGGIPATYQIEDDGCIFATWQARGCIFCASIFEPDAEPEELLALIVK